MFSLGVLKVQAFDPVAKHIKTSKLGLKFMIASRIYNCARYCVIWNNQPVRNSLRLAKFHSLSTRTNSNTYPPSVGSKSHHSALGYNNVFMAVRAAHNSGHDENPEQKSVILYIQNPLRWLVNKLDFGMLRRAWDPTFRENEFKDGTKLAVSSITQLMSSNNFEDLEGLLTPTAINHLRHEVETKWTDVQRRIVFLTKDDIKVALPQRVRFQRLNERKYCDVDMLFLALKQSRYEGAIATIFLEIKVRFHRDFSEGIPPEWTVTMFRVTRFNVLPR